MASSSDFGDYLTLPLAYFLDLNVGNFEADTF